MPMNPRSTTIRFGASLRALHVALLSAATAVSVCLAPNAYAQASGATGGSIATPESGGASAANALALAEVDPSTGILRASYPFDLETPRGKVKLSLGLARDGAMDQRRSVGDP